MTEIFLECKIEFLAKSSLPAVHFWGKGMFCEMISYKIHKYIFPWWTVEILV
jgi:hypothetical protein